jgi:tetratricopeptide (TPR) repeat protein
MLIGIGIGVLGIIMVLTARSITTLLHELGHAIPALVYTTEEVTVYVGSYGDIRNSLPIRLGRFRLFLKFNILDWKMGLCMHKSPAYYVHHFIIILGGPLISLILATWLTWLMFSDGLSDATKVFISLFILSTVWDFLVNIVPVSRPLKLHNGHYTHNDGFQLARMLKLGSSMPDFDEAMHWLEKNEPAKAIGLLEKIRAAKPDSRLVSNAIIETFIDQDAFQEALDEFERFHHTNQIKTHEYKYLGDIYLGLKKWELALKAFNRYLYYVFNDFDALNKKASVLMELDLPDEAIRELEFSLQYEPQNNFSAFLLAGQIYRQQKNWQQARQLLDKALLLKPNSAAIQLQLAFLQEAQYQYQQALHHYQKAQQLGSNYHGINYKIYEMEQLLK